MKKLTLFVLLMLFNVNTLQAQTVPAAGELRKLLQAFLEGASRGDVAMHDRFWADDLIYTRSLGRRVTKAEVMRDVRATPPRKPGDPVTTYTAEDVRIQQYGDTAVVAFRLVGTTLKNETTLVAQFLNSGTFVKRNGKWQVVNWQSTRMPRDDHESRQEVLAVEEAFHHALLVSDLKNLESITDETFIWTQPDGKQLTRKELLDDLRSAKLKYSRLDTKNVVVVIYGDTAVVRGASHTQRSSIPSLPGTGDGAGSSASYTLMFVNQGGDWKAVAMHTCDAK